MLIAIRIRAMTLAKLQNVEYRNHKEQAFLFHSYYYLPSKNYRTSLIGLIENIFLYLHDLGCHKFNIIIPCQYASLTPLIRSLYSVQVVAL